MSWQKFYTYSKLQGSQTNGIKTLSDTAFYTYSKLQGSQTRMNESYIFDLFYTYSKLQGSQTSNCHHRTYILGSIITLLTFILQSNTCLCL